MGAQVDLFGMEIPEALATGRKKVAAIDRLHAAFGTTPGEKCKDCIHFVRKKFSKTYFKCGLGKDTASETTDIRAGDLACGKFEKVV
ncbi:MAG: hypothetical protein IPH04_14825 [Saprospirales bacterium]|nr:hypothetical protein [Saprospirales bacterium]